MGPDINESNKKATSLGFPCRDLNAFFLSRYTDMESEDYSFYKGLVFLLEHNVKDLGYDLTFSTEVNYNDNCVIIHVNSDESICC